MNIETCEALRIDERGAIEWTQLIELSGLPEAELRELGDLDAVGGKDAAAMTAANAALVFARAHLWMLAAEHSDLARELDRRLLPDALHVGHTDVERIGRNDDRKEGRRRFFLGVRSRGG